MVFMFAVTTMLVRRLNMDLTIKMYLMFVLAKRNLIKDMSFDLRAKHIHGHTKHAKPKLPNLKSVAILRQHNQALIQNHAKMVGLTSSSLKNRYNGSIVYQRCKFIKNCKSL